MAYLYRIGRFLAVLLLGLGALPAHALIPQELVYSIAGHTGSSPLQAFTSWVGTLGPRYTVEGCNGASCTYLNQVCRGGVNVENGNNCNPDPQYNPPIYSTNPVGSTAQCPANSTASGNQCSCNATYIETSSGKACVIPADVCTEGESFGLSTFSLGWAKPGEFPTRRVPDAFCFNTSDGYINLQNPGFPKTCRVTSGAGVSVILPSGPVVNGRQQYYQTTELRSSATKCNLPEGFPKDEAPPPCAGQSGTVNGKSICIEPESAASKETRARDAGAAAASAASLAAINAGKTPEQAAAAGAAAGAAAVSTVQAGGSSSSAAAAGSAAGASAGSATAGSGDTGSAASAQKRANDAASAAAAASDRAGQNAANAGYNSDQINAAVAAAAAAARAAINAGQTLTQALAAGSNAGLNAAAGATSKASAAAGAAAAAGAPNPGSSGRGSGNGSGDGSGGDSKFAGQCEGGFTCEGDALQCAMAQEQYKRNCEVFEKKNPYSEALEKALGDPANDIRPEKTTENLSAASFSSENILGGGSCIGDKSVTVMSTTVSLPFSLVCPYLENLGSVLMLCSFLLAIRVVTRG